jgi:hypothetical protein
MKRIIDYDALWSSDRVEKCKPEFRYEYAWLYGLADARGSFELTTTHKIHHRVAAIRPDLTIQKLEDVLAEFERVGLLFTWEAQGKRWGHWVGSTNPGRLPSQSKLDRSHYKVVAPSVPLVELKACCEERDIHLSHWPEDGEGEPEKVAEIVTGENSRAFTDYAVAQFEASSVASQRGKNTSTSASTACTRNLNSRWKTSRRFGMPTWQTTARSSRTSRDIPCRGCAENLTPTPRKLALDNRAVHRKPKRGNSAMTPTGRLGS